MSNAASHDPRDERPQPAMKRARAARPLDGRRASQTRRNRARALSCVVVLLLNAGAAAAGDAPGTHSSERLQKDQRGYAEYQQYCAVCHGVWADGEGLIKPVLTEAPTNLRTLTERHGSPLPRERIAGYIDGRIPVLAHGSKEMPVWGKRLDEGVHSVMPDQRKRSQVMVIVDYLQAIQDEPAPKSSK